MTTRRIDSFFKTVGSVELPIPSSPVEISANKAVTEAMEGTPTRGVKRKRGQYCDYSPETRCKIAKYAIENGNTKAARHFSDILKKDINESTVRSIKSSYNKKKHLQGQFMGTCLPKSPRGRPLKIGKYDEQVKDYIKKLRLSGGIVNSRIVISAAKGIIMANNRTELKQFGGTTELTKAWAISFMNRMGLSKRKGTKGVKHLPEDFNEIQRVFLDRIKSKVEQYNIPDELIVNWDQTGSNFVPVSSWTMEEKGSKQVIIINLL